MHQRRVFGPENNTRPPDEHDSKPNMMRTIESSLWSLQLQDTHRVASRVKNQLSRLWDDHNIDSLWWRRQGCVWGHSSLHAVVNEQSNTNTCYQLVGQVDTNTCPVGLPNIEPTLFLWWTVIVSMLFGWQLFVRGANLVPQKNSGTGTTDLTYFIIFCMRRMNIKPCHRYNCNLLHCYQSYITACVLWSMKGVWSTGVNWARSDFN